MIPKSGRRCRIGSFKRKAAAPGGATAWVARACPGRICRPRRAAHGGLARAQIGLRVERALLAFVETGNAGALQCGGADQDVLATVVWLDEAVSLLLVVRSEERSVGTECRAW